MSRGKQIKTKLKQALLEASLLQEAIKLGSIKAEQKIHEKKSVLNSIREHIGKAIDRVDPLETTVVLAGTIIVHETMLGIGGLSEKLQGLANPLTPWGAWTDVLIAGSPFMWGVIGGGAAVTETQKIDKSGMLLWVISFFVAYLIVKSAGSVTPESVISTLALLGIVV